MEIDCSPEISKDSILANFVIEAGLYDTGSWYNFDGCIDLLSSKVANIQLNPSTASVEFPGYMLLGKLEMPRLWSAEQVRNLCTFSYQIYILINILIKWILLFLFFSFLWLVSNMKIQNEEYHSIQ